MVEGADAEAAAHLQRLQQLEQRDRDLTDERLDRAARMLTSRHRQGGIAVSGPRFFGKRAGQPRSSAEEEDGAPSEDKLRREVVATSGDTASDHREQAHAAEVDDTLVLDVPMKDMEKYVSNLAVTPDVAEAEERTIRHRDVHAEEMPEVVRHKWGNMARMLISRYTSWAMRELETEKGETATTKCEDDVGVDPETAETVAMPDELKGDGAHGERGRPKLAFDDVGYDKVVGCHGDEAVEIGRTALTFDELEERLHECKCLFFRRYGARVDDACQADRVATLYALIEATPVPGFEAEAGIAMARRRQDETKKNGNMMKAMSGRRPAAAARDRLKVLRDI